MHIAFLTPEYPSLNKPEGGLGNYIRKVSLELIQRGHRVTVFILAPQPHNENDQGINLYYVKKTRFHWRLHHFKALDPWLNLYEQWIDAQYLRKVVLKSNKIEHIDILQTPNYKTPGLGLCHNNFFPVVCRCSSYQPLLRSANGIRRRLSDAIADWLEAKQIVEADAAFSPSEFIARTYERFEGVKPVVIRTPIDLTSVTQDLSVYSQLVAGKKYLLVFGALNGVKGVDILIQAIPEVLSANEELSILLVGRNDPLPCGRKALYVLQRDLQDYYQDKRVLYSPSLPKSQLYPIIEHAFGVLMPSRVDNYPNACLEALSLGIPVVGTYDSSLDELIEDGITGFLAENGNPKSLVTAIARLLALTHQKRAAMIQAIQMKIAEIQKEDPVAELINCYLIVQSVFSKNQIE